MSQVHVEAHLCPVHRWTTESHRDRCGVRNAYGDRCGQRFSHSYTFLPLHEHDEALTEARAANLTQPVPGNSGGVEELRQQLMSMDVLQPLVERLFGEDWSADHIAQLEATFNGVCNDLETTGAEER